MNTCQNAKTRSGYMRRPGMTLIELLIVLGLMAAIATVALTTLDGMGDRTRMDTSRNRLDMIEEAIVGDGVSAGRFVSDMGRLPVKHDQIPDLDDPSVIRNIQEGEGLIELWDSLDGSYSSSMPTEFFNGFETGVSVTIYDATMCSNGTLPADPTEMEAHFPATGYSAPDPANAVIVDVPGGWRGPYVQLTGERLFDGFGNAFQLTQDQPAYPPKRTDLVPPIIWTRITDTALLNNVEISGVASYGRDDTEDSTITAELEWPNRDEAKLLDGGRSRATLTVSIRARSAHPTPGGWLSPVRETIDDWKAGEPYTANAIVRVGGDGDDADDLYVCTQPGTSGMAAPTWDRTQPVTDNDVTWEFWQYLPISQYMNRMRVVLFMPFADPDFTSTAPMRARIVTAWSDDGTTQECADSESSSSSPIYCYEPIDRSSASAADLASRRIIFDWTDNHTVELANLPPGIRKLYVYGYYETSGNDITNCYSSGLQTVELNPGTNHMIVCLTESL